MREPSPLRHHRLWRAVRRRSLPILGLALAVGVLAALLVQSLEPVYQSSTTLLVDLGPDDRWLAGDDAAAEVCPRPPAGADSMSTQVQLLRSRALAERVADSLGLWTHPELDPRQAGNGIARLLPGLRSLMPARFLGPGDGEPANEARARQGVVDALERGLEVEPIADSDLIRIAYQASVPRLAAQVAAALANVYIELGKQGRLEAADRGASLLTQRLQELRAQSQAAELKVERLRERQGAGKGGGADRLSDLELDRLAGRVAEARAQRDRLRLELEQTRALANLNDAELVTHPAAIRNPVIQALKTEEVRAARLVSTLGERYGPLHPRMIAARADLEDIQSKLRSEIDATIAAVEKRYQGAETSASQLEQELDELRSDPQENGPMAPALGLLERDAETRRALYEALSRRLDAVKLGRELEGANARVIDGAQVPSRPIWPRKLPLVAGAVGLALSIGLLLAALEGLRDRTLKSATDLERYSTLPVLGTVPLLGRRSLKRATPQRTYSTQPGSDYAEEIRTLRSQVRALGPDEAHGVLLLTSTRAGEGATTVAINLAEALGRLERVLLVDADLRRASIGGRLGLAPDAPGLSNLIAGDSTIEQCLHGIDGSGVAVLPAGVAPPDPLECLSSGRFDEILGDLRQRYDRILLDAAPGEAGSDSLVLARRSDAVLFVVQADAVPRERVQAVLERLQRVQAPLIGAVLNQVDVTTGSHRASTGGQGYGGYGAAVDTGADRSGTRQS